MLCAQSYYNSWLVSQPYDMKSAVCKSICKARGFGQDVVNEFAAGNVMLGITIAEVEKLSVRLDTLNILIGS